MRRDSCSPHGALSCFCKLREGKRDGAAVLPAAQVQMLRAPARRQLLKPKQHHQARLWGLAANSSGAAQQPEFPPLLPRGSRITSHRQQGWLVLGPCCRSPDVHSSAPSCRGARRWLRLHPQPPRAPGKNQSSHQYHTTSAPSTPGEGRGSQELSSEGLWAQVFEQAVSKRSPELQRFQILGDFPPADKFCGGTDACCTFEDMEAREEQR